MIPVLYEKDGTNKIGDLNNCIECLVEEERNGLFEVSLVYPTTDSIFNSLEEENIIICDANDTLKSQKFRIYMTRKLMDNKIEVFARHISFDLAYDIVDNIDITNQSCEYALNTIFRQSQFSENYRGHSDIINAQDYSISRCNCLEAIGGKRGSIIDTFGTGAEILRDNTDIHVLNKRGHDNDVSIEYAKNLTGFELEEDYSELVTRIIPYAKYQEEGTETEERKEVMVEAENVDSPLISNYSHPYISYIDYSDKFEEGEKPTAEKLRKLAEKEYKVNKKDIPKQNFKIEFIPLSKCVGYEGLEDKISLCDKVTIKDTRYNINTQAKVIRTVYDVLKDRYESMELGEPRTTLGDIIGGGGNGEDGAQGPPGPPGPPGEDGNIGDFPNTLPPKSVLTGKSIGLASIELTWTFENKVYYSYELYASKQKGFTPNSFDLIYEGQASAFLYQVKPNETWYFRVCAINSYGDRNEFSDEISVTTAKINGNDWIEKATIGNALIGELSADKITSGTISGHYIDARNLSVTDGNGKRTLDIDSYGNVNLDVASLKIASKSAITEEQVDTKISVANGSINTKIENIEQDVETLETQTADKFSWIVKSGTSSSNFTITDRLAQLVSQDIELIADNIKGRIKNEIEINDNSGSRLFRVYKNANVKFGPDTGHSIDGWSRAKAEITSNGTIYLTRTSNNYTRIDEGSIFCQASNGVSARLRDGYVSATEYIQSPGLKTSNSTLYLGINDVAIPGSGDNASRLEFTTISGNKYFRPGYDGTVRLGSTSYRWSTVYAQNGVSTSSDRTVKTNINYLNRNAKTNEITHNDMLNFINNDYALATYNYIDTETNEAEKELKLSAIAQDLLVNADGSDNKLGQMVVECEQAYAEQGKLSINQTQLLNVTIGAIQKLSQKVDDLEKQLNEFKK